MFVTDSAASGRAANEPAGIAAPSDIVAYAVCGSFATK
jgi:hypothetical protein